MGILPAHPPPYTHSHSKICRKSAPPPGLCIGCHWNVWFHMGVVLYVGLILESWCGVSQRRCFLPLPNHDNQHITIVDIPSTHKEEKMNKDFRKNKETWKILKHNKYFLPFAINLKILNLKYSITYATCHNLFRTLCCMQYKLPRISRHGEK